MLVFQERGKIEAPGEKPSEQGENQEQTTWKPKYSVGWNQALATLVGGDTLTSKPTLIIVKCIQVARAIITVSQLHVGIWTNWIWDKNI